MKALMIRKQWLNLLLIAVAAALVVVVITGRERPTTAESESRKRHLLTVFRDDALTRIEIVRAGSRLVLERREDPSGAETWRILEPIAEAADPFAVDKLRRALEFATRIRDVTPTGSGQMGYGISATSDSIRVGMGAVSYLLRFGGEAPSPSGARYVRVERSGAERAEDMALVSAESARQLLVGVDDVRDRQLVPYSGSSLREVRVQNANGTQRVVQDAEAVWTVPEPAPARRADRSIVDGLLVQIARLQADHFVSVEKARELLAGTTVVDLQLLPTTTDRPKVEFKLGGTCPNAEHDVLALRSAPSVVAACVPKAVLAAFAGLGDKLLDTGLFWARADEVETLTIQAERRLVLTRAGSEFTLKEPGPRSVALDVGTARLQALLDLRGTLLNEGLPETIRLDERAASIVLEPVHSADKPVSPERVRYAQRGDAIYALRERDGALLRLGSDAAAALSPDPTPLRARRVLELKPGDVSSLLIVRGTDRQNISRAASGGFEYTEPSGLQVDEALVTDLLQRLSHLETPRWVADKASANTGLAAPSSSVVVSFAEATQAPVTLLIGNATAGGYFATAGEGVFVLERSDAELLGSILADRSATMFELDDVARIVLSAGSRELTLTKSDDVFRSSLPDDRSAELAESLRSLRAEAALTLSTPPPGAFGASALRVSAFRADGAVSKRITIGSAEVWRDLQVRLVRVDENPATFVIAASKLRRLLDAL